MHPLLARPARAWLMRGTLAVSGALLGTVPLIGAGADPLEAAAFAAWGWLLMFLAVQSWHLARYVPIDSTSFPRFLGTVLGSAVIVSGLWLLIGWNGARLADAWLPSVMPAFDESWLRLWTGGAAGYLLVLFLTYAVMAADEGELAARRALEADVASRAAELRALRAQVNPHFLFNCLNSVSSLIGHDAARARTMCLELAEFFRASLKAGAEQRVSLTTELALLRRYLVIEQVRFGSRLDPRFETHGELADVFVPPLLLQPLVENAVRHGVATLLDGGLVRIAATRADDRVEIVVENAFDPDGRRAGTGVGLANVRERLEAAYRGHASVRAETVAPAGDGDQPHTFKVVISLPAGHQERT